MLTLLFQIAMFELISEIDQVGRRLAEDGSEIAPASYSANPALYANWHLEMAAYLKNNLGLRNLLTASYTTGGIDDELDNTYGSNNIDVVSVNNYNYFISNVHGFHKNRIGFLVSDEGHEMPKSFVTFHWQKYYNKPIFFSESGAHDLWECDNHIETRRNIWQNAFWGISGALDWDFEMLHNHSNSTPKVWSIYERVAEFFDDVDLDGGNWHAGMTQIKNDGTLEYNKSYRDDCIRNDELADVVYLRSGDKQRAFGVITNRRANYYTLGEGKCTQNTLEIPRPTNEELHTHESVSPGLIFNRLRIRNMAGFDAGGLLEVPIEYVIRYYSPYDQTTPLKTEVKLSSILTLEYPELDTLDVVLFEASPFGINFKSGDIDTTDSDDSLTREPKKEKEDDVKVYPNPNDGSFIVAVDNSENAKLIRLIDNLGKEIDNKNVVMQENNFNNTNFRSGVYFLEVIFEDKTIRKKVVIK